jgi:hypothetical protein
MISNEGLKPHHQEQMISITSQQYQEYQALKSKSKRVKNLEKIARNAVLDKIRYLNKLIADSKYNPDVWLRQFNLDTEKRDKGSKIDNLFEELVENKYKPTVEEKKEVGFRLYCDFLRSIASEINWIKSVVNCNLYFVNDSRSGELLALFGNPQTKEDLEKAYNSNLEFLKGELSKLQHTVVNEQNDSQKAAINQDIENYQKAIKDLKGFRQSLINDWDTKVNPKDPGVDDRNLKDKNLKNQILKMLAGKELAGSETLELPSAR